MAIVADAGADAAVVGAVVVGPGLALAAAVDAADAATAEALEAALARGHAGAHGGVDGRGALAAPCLCPIKGLEMCLVLWCDGAAVLERGHALSGLVDIGVVVLLLGALDELRVVVGAGKGAA